MSPLPSGEVAVSAAGEGLSTAYEHHHGAVMNVDTTKRARALRERQTESESLLWDVLRAKRLSGLKFRRQHPIGPFYADFACIAQRLIVEIDGGYHDYQFAEDMSRQRFLEEQGWSVIRFSNEDVIEDVEAVAIAIAKRIGVKAEFGKRKRVASGMRIKRDS